MRQSVAVAIAVGALLACAPAAPAISGTSVEGTSADGQFVLVKTAARLAPEDVDDFFDLYVWSNGTYRLVSTGPASTNANSFDLRGAFLSEDGNRVLFETSERLTADDVDGSVDVYERVGNQTNLVSTGPTDPGPSLPLDERENGIYLAGHSADGSYAFFNTLGRMTSADTDAVRDVYQRRNGETKLVSTDLNGANTPSAATFSGVSADGARVLVSTADALRPDDLDQGKRDAYAKHGATTELVTRGLLPDAISDATVEEVSADARSVVFATQDSIHPQDVDGMRDLYQRRNGTTRLVSADQNGLSLPCRTAATDPRGITACDPVSEAQSEDGTHVVFATAEPLVAADRNLGRDHYDWSAQGLAGLTVADQIGDRDADGRVMLSPDGARIVFESKARLAPGGGGDADIYERFQGQTRLLSPPPLGPAQFAFAALEGTSRDARHVVFQTSEPLVPEDTDGTQDLYETFNGVTTLVSGGSEDIFAQFNAISADGLSVFFSTTEQLTPDDTDDTADAYMRRGGTLTLLSG